MAKRKRRQFTSEEKAAILRRYMVDKVAVSDLCNELGIQPSLFYHWQRQALAPAPAAGYAQAVALTHGRGRVVVFGEAAMASAQRDGGRRIGMNAPGAENRLFVSNTLHWLTRLLPSVSA